MGWFMNITIKKQPQIEPVSLSDVKAYLRIDHVADDESLKLLITTARQLIENYTGRALIHQVRRLTVDFVRHGQQAFRLPGSPFKKIKKCRQIIDGQHEELAGYVVDVAKPVAEISVNGIRLKQAHLQVDYLCGYGALSDDVPAALRQGIMMLVAELYENRLTGTLTSTQTDILPRAVRMLVEPYRVIALV